MAVKKTVKDQPEKAKATKPEKEKTVLEKIEEIFGSPEAIIEEEKAQAGEPASVAQAEEESETSTTQDTPSETVQPAEQPEGKPVKSDKAHAKAAENDAKAGNTQMHMVEPTIEQRWFQIGTHRAEEIELEDDLSKVNAQKKGIESELTKVREKITALENIAANIPVQKKLAVDESKKEELRRHPQEA